MGLGSVFCKGKNPDSAPDAWPESDVYWQHGPIKLPHVERLLGSRHRVRRFPKISLKVQGRRCGVRPLDNGRLTADAENKTVTVPCPAVLRLNLWWVQYQVCCPWWEHCVLWLVERNASPISKSPDDYLRKDICVSNCRSWEFWLVLGSRVEVGGKWNQASLEWISSCNLVSGQLRRNHPLVLDLLSNGIPWLSRFLSVALRLDRPCGMVRVVHRSVIKISFCPLLTSATWHILLIMYTFSGPETGTNSSSFCILKEFGFQILSHWSWTFC